MGNDLLTAPEEALHIERVPCRQCPLRLISGFRQFETGELNFVQSFKQGDTVAKAGALILHEGAHSPALFTLLSGWAFRFKTLDDGRRQILNYVLPGDLVGLQGSVMGQMTHSVEALTPVVLCVFERHRLSDLFTSQPGLAFDLTWLAAREERMLDEHLLSVGRRTSAERTAYLLAFLHQRAVSVGLGATKRLMVPISQQHVADTLGLSIVHTNRMVKKLTSLGLIHWHDRACEVLDLPGLVKLANWEGQLEPNRPFL